MKQDDRNVKTSIREEGEGFKGINQLSNHLRYKLADENHSKYADNSNFYTNTENLFSV